MHEGTFPGRIAIMLLAVSFAVTISSAAEAQTIEGLFKQFMGTTKTRRAKRSRPMPVPPLPVRQPRPWHNSAFDTPKTVEAGSVDSATLKTAKSGPSAIAPSAPVANHAPAVDVPPKRPMLHQDAQPEEEEIVVEDVFTPEQIEAAQKRCSQVLAKTDAVTAFEFPIKEGSCGDAAPVKLLSLGTNPEVAVVPPAVVNCDMVAGLARWVKRDLQPLARKHLKSRVVTLENMSSYSCRTVSGRKKLSEHAKANALDIRGFVTEEGVSARLLSDWGPTRRAIKASKKARLKFLEQRKEAAATSAKAPRAEKTPPNIPASANRGGQLISTAAVPAPGRKPVSSPPTAKAPPPPQLTPSTEPAAKFLKAVHKAACRRFGTVLGPEANNAHLNHFHVDLAKRRSGSYCR